MAVLAVVTSTTPAWAEGDEPPSYTLQVVAADATAVGLIAASALADDTFASETIAPGIVAAVGVGVYVFGATVVHQRQGQSDRAAISVTLRLGLPLALGTLGYVTSEGCDGWFCELDAMGVGVLGGAALASIIDYTLLSRGTVLARPRRRADTGWAPTVAPTAGGAQVGVVGTW